jgi:hypothetical protein
MEDKITEYRKANPRCRYCKHSCQNNFSWTCLAKQQSHYGSLSETIFKGMFCKLFEAKEH